MTVPATVDNCEALIPEELPAANIHHTTADIIGALIEGRNALSGLFSCDIACSFGVMHHVPGVENRAKFLDELVKHTNPGGLVIVSLWRFLDIEGLAAKAQRALEVAQNDEGLPVSLRDQLLKLYQQGDCLLGWQREAHVWRYCHSFGDDDIQTLIDSVSGRAACIARFRSDGSSGSANEYLILKRRTEA